MFKKSNFWALLSANISVGEPNYQRLRARWFNALRRARINENTWEYDVIAPLLLNRQSGYILFGSVAQISEKNIYFHSYVSILSMIAW